MRVGAAGNACRLAACGDEAAGCCTAISNDMHSHNAVCLNLAITSGHLLGLSCC